MDDRGYIFNTLEFLEFLNDVRSIKVKAKLTLEDTRNGYLLCSYIKCSHHSYIKCSHHSYIKCSHHSYIKCSHHSYIKCSHHSYIKCSPLIYHVNTLNYTSLQPNSEIFTSYQTSTILLLFYYPITIITTSVTLNHPSTIHPSNPPPPSPAYQRCHC